MSKHTKGPWTWNEYTWLDGADGNPVIDYAGCGSHECEISEADRSLIAAAPDLLEALENLFACDMEYFLMCDGKDDQIEAIQQAKDAIAKAKGGMK